MSPRRRVIALITSLLLFVQVQALAQTMVVAIPVSDPKGMVAFQISEIIKVEGDWDPALAIGDLLYPQQRQKAHPIMRFGEAVVIALTEPGNRTKWQGLHVHNGCIPALQGKPLEEMVHEIVVQAELEAKEEAQRVASGGEPKASAKTATKSGEEQFAVCPICKQRHIRIR